MAGGSAPSEKAEQRVDRVNARCKVRDSTRIVPSCGDAVVGYRVKLSVIIAA
jgi:hypothetical protein